MTIIITIICKLINEIKRCPYDFRGHTSFMTKLMYCGSNHKIVYQNQLVNECARENLTKITEKRKDGKSFFVRCRRP